MAQTKMNCRPWTKTSCGRELHLVHRRLISGQRLRQRYESSPRVPILDPAKRPQQPFSALDLHVVDRHRTVRHPLLCLSEQGVQRNIQGFRNSREATGADAVSVVLLFLHLKATPMSFARSPCVNPLVRRLNPNAAVLTKIFN